MTARPSWLSTATQSLGRYEEANRLQPLAHFCGTPPQRAFWSHPSRRRLLRTGNQVGGKTTAACIEGLWWCTHTHPYRRTPSSPVQVWFICVSWSQSLAIQRKMWQLTPKQALTSDTMRRYSAERGFGANTPVMTFLDGSQIWFRTGKQDPLDQAGATLHLVLYDEPPKRQRNFFRARTSPDPNRWRDVPHDDAGECTRRLDSRDGAVGCVDRLALPLHARDAHSSKRGPCCGTEAGDLMDAAWIAGERKKVLAFEEPVLIDGEWEMRSDGAVWEGWDPTKHWIRDLYEHPDVGPKGRPVRLVLGIDWGDERLRTAAVLCAVQIGNDRKGTPTRVWVLDQYTSEGPTTVAMDADAVLAMLAVRGLRWSQLAAVWGDKQYTDATGRLVKKSNRKFERMVAARLGLSSERTVPPVGSAKRGTGKGPGALWTSVRWIHERMLTSGGFAVDAKCEAVRESIETWDGTKMHAAKDLIDAMRYALCEYWAPSRVGRRSMASKLKIR